MTEADQTYATLTELLGALGRGGDANSTGDLEDWLETHLHYDVDLAAYLDETDDGEHVTLSSDAGELPSLYFPLTRSQLDQWILRADQVIANGLTLAPLRDWDYDDDPEGPDSDLIAETVAGVLGVQPAELREDLSSDSWEVLDEHGVVGHSTAPDVLVSWKQRVVLGLSAEYLSVHPTHWDGPDLVIDDGYSAAFIGEWDLIDVDREQTYATVVEAMRETLRTAPPRPLPPRPKRPPG